MHFPRSLSVPVMLCVTASGLTAAGQHVTYVDVNASGPEHDGRSWCTAYIRLSKALRVASSGDVIHVADGLYVPVDNDVDDPRDATFALPDGVVLKGGYAGCGAENPDERDPETFPTTLSGDLRGDDGPGFANNADNAYHVITCFAAGTATKLSGVTVTAGNANGRWEENRHTGAGMLNLASDPVIRRCTFRANAALGTDGSGAGMANLLSDASVRSCTFAENAATYGGGMLNMASVVFVGSSEFRANVASIVGGGALSILGSNLTVQSSAFTLNRATSREALGGGLHGDDSTLTLKDCAFESNTSQLSGGGVGARDCSVTVERCLIRDNAGGGLHFKSGSSQVVDSLVDANRSTASYSGGLYCSYGTRHEIARCAFTRNTAAEAGGLRASGDYVTVDSCLFEDNSSTYAAGGADISGYFQNAISHCQFRSNSAGRSAGGLYLSGRNPTLSWCEFIDNTGENGGGLYFPPGSTPVEVVNCAILENRANSRGGALYAQARDMVFKNCTIAGNGIDALYRSSSSLTMVNCVYWGNLPAGIPGAATITYSPCSSVNSSRF